MKPCRRGAVLQSHENAASHNRRKPVWRARGQAHVTKQRMIRPLSIQQVILHAYMHARSAGVLEGYPLVLSEIDSLPCSKEFLNRTVD